MSFDAIGAQISLKLAQVYTRVLIFSSQKSARVPLQSNHLQIRFYEYDNIIDLSVENAIKAFAVANICRSEASL